MSVPTSSQELYDILKAANGDAPEAVDVTSLRYILYARKSTYDDERQERSIPDQLHDCLDRVIGPKSLKIVSEIREKCSAKEPDIRPKFRAMINDIKAGKANGIVAWHPDRLSRNMKEAGEIIDLVDKGVIKDLQFATSNFENTPTGKMMLGISFVLSKQYSEHLSESVTRGNKRITEGGAYIGKFKHGYYISEDRKLYPDGENFLLIKKAFRMRLAGETQTDIARWLNTTSYEVRHAGKEATKFTWDKDAVSKLLRDPVYTGVLRYGKHLVHLPAYYDFEPAISTKDFMSINKISPLDAKSLESAMVARSPRKTKATLLRGMVRCGYCNKPFSSSITSKKVLDSKKHYYYYKCENDVCVFKNKGIRAAIVINMVLDFLAEYRFTTRSNYERHVARVRATNQKRLRSLNSEIASLIKLNDILSKEYENAKNLVLGDPKLVKHYDLDKMESDLKASEDTLTKLLDKRKAVKNAVITYKKYLELFENTSVSIPKIHDINLLNEIVRFFFSNFTVKASGTGKQRRYDITYNLKEPWAGFLKNNDFVRGRGERTRTSDLTVPNRAR